MNPRHGEISESEKCPGYVESRFERFVGDILFDFRVALRFGVVLPLNVSTKTPSKPNVVGAALRFRLLEVGDFPIFSEFGVVTSELTRVVA